MNPEPDVDLSTDIAQLIEVRAMRAKLDTAVTRIAYIEGQLSVALRWLDTLTKRED